jgi:quercetin dioxygenase-like cupin family protein
VWTDPTTGATRSTRHLVAPGNVGATEIVLAVSEYAPRVTPPIDGDPATERWMVALAGAPTYLAEGAQVPLAEGDVVYVPPGESHAIGTPKDSGCSLCWGVGVSPLVS